jgi:DNA-binding NarL/FixJ family response regulator
MAELAIQIARRGPLVLLLDDVHWASDLGLFAHLARRLAETPILLLAATRQQEFRDQPNLVREWNDLERARLGIRIGLEPFSAVETTQLISHYLGAGPAAQLADSIYRQTRGNAFFIEEVLRAQAELGALRPSPSGWEVAGCAQSIIPDTMRFIIQDRVDRLGDDAPRILAQAAVLGQEFAFEALRLMTGLDEDRLLLALERAVAARLLRDVSSPSEERYAFWDDQIQEVLYASLAAPRLYRFHRRAGEALEVLQTGRPHVYYEELARHFGASRDFSRVAKYAFLAAEQHEQLHNWARAAPLYGQAAEALDRLPETRSVLRQRAEALYRQVQLSFFADRPLDNLERLRTARHLISDLMNAPEEGADAGEPVADRRMLSWLDYWIGRLLIYELEYRAALSQFERVEAASEIEGDRELHAVATSSIGRTYVEMGDFASAVPFLTRAARALADLGNWSEWVWNAAFLGIARAGYGEAAAGLAEATQALARVDEIGERNLIGPCNVFLGMVHLLNGDCAGTIECGRAAIAAAEATGHRFPAHLSSGLIAWAESRRGRPDVAQEWLQQLQASGTELGGRLVFGDWFLVAAAELALNAGQPDEAWRLSDEAVGVADAAGDIFAGGLARRVRARAGAEQSHALNTSSDLDEDLAAALRAFSNGGAAPEVAQTHLVWSRLDTRRGRVASARAHAESALRQFQSLGRNDEAEEARAQLSSLDASTACDVDRLPTRSYPDGLSAREVDVLRRIAAGCTTREIAGDLAVSIATVERQITSLYTKIGARGRAAATAYALRQGLGAVDPTNR